MKTRTEKKVLRRKMHPLMQAVDYLKRALAAAEGAENAYGHYLFDEPGVMDIYAKSEAVDLPQAALRDIERAQAYLKEHMRDNTSVEAYRNDAA